MLMAPVFTQFLLQKIKSSFISLFPSFNPSINSVSKFQNLPIFSPISTVRSLPPNRFLHFCSYLLRVQIPLSSQYKSDHITSLLKIVFRIKTKFSTVTYKAFRALTCISLTILTSCLSDLLVISKPPCFPECHNLAPHLGAVHLPFPMPRTPSSSRNQPVFLAFKHHPLETFLR